MFTWVVDPALAVEVWRAYMWRESEYTGWILRQEGAVLPFEVYEVIERRPNLTVLRLTIRLGSAPSLMEMPEAPRLTLSSVEHENAVLMLAVEAVLVHYGNQASTDVRVWALDRAWRLADFGYGSQAVSDGVDEEDTRTEARADRPSNDAVAEALASYSTATGSDPAARLDFGALRGLEAPVVPGVPHVPEKLGSCPGLGDAFVGSGGLERLADLVVDSRSGGALSSGSREWSWKVRSLCGAPVDEEAAAGARILVRAVEDLESGWRMFKGLGGNAFAYPLATALSLHTLLDIRDFDALARGLAALAGEGETGARDATAALGFLAAMRGRAPIGWVPFCFVAGGHSVPSLYRRVVVSTRSPNVGRFLDHWFDLLCRSTPLPVSADPRNPEMCEYLRLLAP